MSGAGMSRSGPMTGANREGVTTGQSLQLTARKYRRVDLDAALGAAVGILTTAHLMDMSALSAAISSALTLG